jgi:hypothetical protein
VRGILGTWCIEPSLTRWLHASEASWGLRNMQSRTLAANIEFSMAACLLRGGEHAAFMHGWEYGRCLVHFCNEHLNLSAGGSCRFISAPNLNHNSFVCIVWCLQAVANGGYEILEGPYELGEVSFHAGWSFHRANGNKSDSTREVFTVIYIDKVCRAPGTSLI